MKYVLALAVVVEAETISDVDDDTLGNALIAFPEVVEVSSLGPVETTVARDDDRTVWADVMDVIRP